MYQEPLGYIGYSQGNQSKGRSLSFLMLYVSQYVEVLCRRPVFLGDKFCNLARRPPPKKSSYRTSSPKSSPKTKSLRNQTLLSFERRRLYTLQKYHQKPKKRVKTRDCKIFGSRVFSFKVHFNVFLEIWTLPPIVTTISAILLVSTPLKTDMTHFQ